MSAGDGATPLERLLAAVAADPSARAAASAALLDFDRSAIATDRWTRCARPSFLYVMYALLLWAIPLGLIAAFRPAVAHAIATGMTAYLAGIPEPLYALFGTGYLGYTAAREWGKARGS